MITQGDIRTIKVQVTKIVKNSFPITTGTEIRKQINRKVNIVKTKMYKTSRQQTKCL